jgi:ABC-type antimicrobial peptide transport system permease subunit
LSVLQHPARPVNLMVQPSNPGLLPDTLAARLVAASLASSTSQVVDGRVARLLAVQRDALRWFAILFAFEGWTVLAIALVGTGSMMWLWVSSLTGELGLRRAVGASRWCVMRYVLLRTILVAAAGVAVGSWIGIALWDGIRQLVSGLPPWDTRDVLRVSPLLFAAAAAGAWPLTLQVLRTPIARWLS